MTKVFISYARLDDRLTNITKAEEHTYHLDSTRSFTRQLYNALTKANFEVWWDREDMPNRGLTFLNEIKNAVAQCDYMIYVAGEHALKSDYVKAEWQYAVSMCIPVIPILRNGNYASHIPVEIGMGNAPDMRDMSFFDDKIKELIRLLSDEPMLATLYSVPIWREWLIERNKDVQNIQKSLRADALKPVVATSKQQILILHGMAGLGKTTLATAVSRLCDVRFSFPDGVFWIEMGKNPPIPTRQGDIGVAFGDVLDEYPDRQRGKSRLSDILKNKAVLIVLNDVWDYRHVDAFSVNAPQSRLLVTTRIGHISTQLGVSSYEINVLTENEGVELIGKRLGRDPSADNPYLVEERKIVEYLGGHTLAISIASAKISEKGAEYTPRFRERLEKRRVDKGNPLGDLIVTSMKDDDKNYNLELSLAESYVDLTSDRQSQFRALGVFADSTFDLPAIQAVWGIDDEYKAEDLLSFFVNMSLLTETKDGRYIQHSLLRDYAYALSNSNEQATNQQRHFMYYIGEYNDYDQNLIHPEENLHLQRDTLDSNWANILSALTWGFIHEAQTSCNFVISLQDYMITRHSRDEHLSLLEESLLVAKSIDYQEGQAFILESIGDLYRLINENEVAFGKLENALSIFEEIGNLRGQATTLVKLSDNHRIRREFHKAIQHSQRAFNLSIESNYLLGQAQSLMSLANIYYSKHEYDEAVWSAKEALQTLEKVSYSRESQAQMLRLLGNVHRMKRQYHAAIHHFELALDHHIATEDKFGKANTLIVLGEVFRATNQLEQAIFCLQDALSLLEPMNNWLGIANIFRTLGLIHLKEGKYEKASDKLDYALNIYKRIDNTSEESSTLVEIGNMHLKKYEYTEAIENFENAFILGKATINFLSQLNSLKGLASTYYAIDEIDNACDKANKLINLANRIDSYKNDIIIDEWRKEFISWGCELD